MNDLHVNEGILPMILDHKGNLMHKQEVGVVNHGGGSPTHAHLLHINEVCGPSVGEYTCCWITCVGSPACPWENPSVLHAASTRG